MEKLKSEDYLYSFFLAPGGTTVWIVERNGEIMLQGILNNSAWTCEHWPSSRRDSISEVTASFKMLGFKEFPIFCRMSKEIFRKNQDVNVLLDQFKIYENERGRKTKDRNEIAENKESVQLNE